MNEVSLINDIINSGFEFFSGIFVLINCRRVMKDKAVAGVSLLATAFFVAWGFWNIYYYNSLDQVWSSVGAVSICIGNSVWLYLLWKYRNGVKEGWQNKVTT